MLCSGYMLAAQTATHADPRWRHRPAAEGCLSHFWGIRLTSSFIFWWWWWWRTPSLSCETCWVQNMWKVLLNPVFCPGCDAGIHWPWVYLYSLSRMEELDKIRASHPWPALNIYRTDVHAGHQTWTRTRTGVEMWEHLLVSARTLN